MSTSQPSPGTPAPAKTVRAETREELLTKLGPVAPIAEELLTRMAGTPAPVTPTEPTGGICLDLAGGAPGEETGEAK